MSSYLELFVDQITLIKLIDGATPLIVHFSDPMQASSDQQKRWIEIERPSLVELIPDRGIRIESRGRLQYALLGIKVPVQISTLRVLLRPLVASLQNIEHALIFDVSIEDLDVEFMPDFLDRELQNRINQLLTSERGRLAWDFGKTLTRLFPLPQRFEPESSLQLLVDGGSVHVERAGLRFRVNLDAQINR